MASFPDQQSQGMFLATTNIWDPTELYNIEVTSEDFKELMIRLYQNLNIISSVINLKDTGYYTSEELANGQSFFPNPKSSEINEQINEYRGVFRKTINFGALPNAAVKSVKHNIEILGSYSFTRIYGAASDMNGRLYIPLPHASVNPIEITVDATNINIRTTNNATNFTTSYVVLEYIKS